MEDFKKMFPENKIDILYYNPIISLKLKENQILAHLFKNNENNYYEIKEGNNINYYNMKKIKIKKYKDDEFEKGNESNWKMNVLMKLN